MAADAGAITDAGPASGAGEVEVPQFETTCSYVEATLEEFLTWNCDQSSISGPFRDYDHSKFWAYADYKYFVNLFEDKTDVFQVSAEETLVLGDKGARIPYEESSVFSKINVVNPDVKRFPQFQKARRHTVTLSPGQVEETSHEVNCRYLNGAVSAFFDHYGTSQVVETQALRTNRERRIKEELNVHNHMESEPTGRPSLTSGTVKQEAASPFGPDLVPVIPSSQEPPSERGGIFERDGEDFVGKNGGRLGKLHCTKRQRMVSESENAAVEQTASNSALAPSQTFISTDDLLDCLVNPQVTRIVAQLLIQRSL
ncbi:hypothetical protein CB1_001278020 [Camelus ferus]|nr:hypothetical protein CB1_001278020 [Camelus ferus]